MTRLVLHIDRLVLRGVERADAAAVSAALQARLQTLLAADGGEALRQRAGTPMVRLGRVPLGAGRDAPALGEAVAERIANVPPASKGTMP